MVVPTIRQALSCIPSMCKRNVARIYTRSTDEELYTITTSWMQVVSTVCHCLTGLAMPE